MPDFITDPARDATPSIRGYVYQIYQSTLAWLRLNGDEVLILEGAEDFDVHLQSSVVATQVKDLTGNLTLRSKSVVEALNNFWGHCEKNPDHTIQFRFLSTAAAGLEKGEPFGKEIKGLEIWRRVAEGAHPVTPIKSFLLTLGLSDSFRAFLESASDEVIVEKIVSPMKWDLGQKSIEALQADIENKLIFHGAKFRISPHYSRNALPHLLKKIADRLTKNGRKEITYGDFSMAFEEATTESIPKGELEALRSGGALVQLAATADALQLAQLAIGPRSLGLPQPIVDGAAIRKGVVEEISKPLKEGKVIFLHGSSGLGKTNLAALLSCHIGGDWKWISLRSVPPNDIKNILVRATFELNALNANVSLVIDDLDFNTVGKFEYELIALISSVKNADGKVIVTGQNRPPLNILPKLWLQGDSEVSVPYFNEDEILETIVAHGLTDGSRAQAWARTIWLTTSGHPQLVHARVRNLSAGDWAAASPIDIVRPQDVERIREDARNRLVQELPSEGARVLAYRLSLITGGFSRATAMALASSPPPVSLPGEAFDILVGPWIEREGDDRFRVSPLLTGAANNVLSANEVTATHTAIAVTYFKKKTLNQYDLGTALFHAVMAKSTFLIMKFCEPIIAGDRDNIAHIAEATFWLPMLASEAGQKILPDLPSVELFLRLAQYKIASATFKQDEALNVIARIEECISAIEIPELKLYSEALSYGTILNTIDIHIPAATVVRLLARLIDIPEGTKEAEEKFQRLSLNLPRIGENKPAQVLFSYQAVRVSGMSDLIELVDSVDALDAAKRDHLLKVCDSEADFSHLLISRAWWRETTNGSLDAKRVLQGLTYTSNKARSWGKLELVRACLVAMSVVEDEYRNDIGAALSILDGGENEFPNDANLLNQRAKVLFHADEHQKSLDICKTLITRTDLPNVDRAFMMRSAGISAAKLGDWSEASRLFYLGEEQARSAEMRPEFIIGLQADVAFAQWEAEDKVSSLKSFADALDALEVVPITEDLQSRHVHATVRHSIIWTHFSAQGHGDDAKKPYPGMCSNLAPDEGLKSAAIKKLSMAWEVLANTEQTLGVEAGISGRAKEKTEGKSTLLLAASERTFALELLLRNQNFERLIPCLLGMLEARVIIMNARSGLIDEWSTGNIPPLARSYWDDANSVVILSHYILLSTTILTGDRPGAPFPIAKWRADLASASVPEKTVSGMLDALEGHNPANELYSLAGAALFQLKASQPAPDDLWRAFFRLLNAFATGEEKVSSAFDKITIRHWTEAASNQRFAFSNPSVICPIVEELCQSAAAGGIQRAAAILDETAGSLRISLAPEAKTMLDTLRRKGKVEI
jgi:hypothetical protein